MASNVWPCLQTRPPSCPPSYPHTSSRLIFFQFYCHSSTSCSQSFNSSLCLRINVLILSLATWYYSNLVNLTFQLDTPSSVLFRYSVISGIKTLICDHTCNVPVSLSLLIYVTDPEISTFHRQSFPSGFDPASHQRYRSAYL